MSSSSFAIVRSRCALGLTGAFACLIPFTFLSSGEEASVKKKKEKPRAEQKRESAAVEKDEPAEKKPKTHRVEPEEFVVVTELTGVIESRSSMPIAFDLARWSDMRVVSVVPHGSKVAEGDVLIELDTEKLEKKIRELELELPATEADLRTAELELSKLVETTPILKEKAMKAKSQAEDDLSYFRETTRPMRERDVEEDLKSTQNYLAYAEEELAQLKKMYERDDLTEETEEIILQRAQNTVDNYKWMLEQTKERGERTLSTLIPREQEQLETAVKLRDLEWKTDDKTFDENLGKKELEVEKMRRALEEARLSLEEHRSDLAAMRVTAPMDGIVYYGLAQRGKWTTASTVDRKLIPGGSLTMREVIMTIVDPDDIQMRVAVKEDQLRDLTPGKNGTATLKWNPDMEMRAKVESVSYVPYADNTFDAVLSLSDLDEAVPILPGMEVTAKIDTYVRDAALVVPVAAVEEKDGGESVILENGETREVVTGRTSEKKVEILEGLEAGDVVLLEKAEEDAKAESKEKTEEKKGPGEKAETK